jgi:hypothetical protein
VCADAIGLHAFSHDNNLFLLGSIWKAPMLDDSPLSKVFKSEPYLLLLSRYVAHGRGACLSYDVLVGWAVNLFFAI